MATSKEVILPAQQAFLNSTSAQTFRFTCAHNIRSAPGNAAKADDLSKSQKVKIVGERYGSKFNHNKDSSKLSLL